jgi:hypothetical protein
MSFLTAAVIVGGSALASGYMGAKAAKDAAGMQVAGMDRATAAQQAQYERTREDYAPYRELGYTALKDIEALKPLLTAQFGPEQFEQYLDPSMDFRRRLGEQTTARALNVGGGFFKRQHSARPYRLRPKPRFNRVCQRLQQISDGSRQYLQHFGKHCRYGHGRNKPRRSIWSGCGSKHWNAGRRKRTSTGFRNYWAGSSMAKFVGSGK